MALEFTFGDDLHFCQFLHVVEDAKGPDPCSVPRVMIPNSGPISARRFCRKCGAFGDVYKAKVHEPWLCYEHWKQRPVARPPTIPWYVQGTLW